jgi:hypothetical protein
LKIFFYNGSNKKVQQIAHNLNKLFADEKFWVHVRHLGQFDMSLQMDGSGVNGVELEALIKTNKIKCHINLYRHWWRWSRVNGYYKGGKDIWINERRLWRSERSIANTIGHEYIHLVDNYLADDYLGHGDNSPKGKEKTCPWMFGSLIEDRY